MWTGMSRVETCCTIFEYFFVAFIISLVKDKFDFHKHTAKKAIVGGYVAFFLLNESFIFYIQKVIYKTLFFSGARIHVGLLDSSLFILTQKH